MVKVRGGKKQIDRNTMRFSFRDFVRCQQDSYGYRLVGSKGVILGLSYILSFCLVCGWDEFFQFVLFLGGDGELSEGSR